MVSAVLVGAEIVTGAGVGEGSTGCTEATLVYVSSTGTVVIDTVEIGTTSVVTVDASIISLWVWVSITSFITVAVSSITNAVW